MRPPWTLTTHPIMERRPHDGVQVAEVNTGPVQEAGKTGQEGEANPTPSHHSSRLWLLLRTPDRKDTVAAGQSGARWRRLRGRGTWRWMVDPRMHQTHRHITPTPWTGFAVEGCTCPERKTSRGLPRRVCGGYPQYGGCAAMFCYLGPEDKGWCCPGV